MPAFKADILIEQGATFQRDYTVTLKGQDIPNLGDYAVRGMLRTNTGTLAEVFSVAVTGPRTITATLSATATAALPAAPGYTHKYDIEAEAPGGIVYRVVQGRATISEEQTK